MPHSMQDCTADTPIPACCSRSRAQEGQTRCAGSPGATTAPLWCPTLQRAVRGGPRGAQCPPLSGTTPPSGRSTQTSAGVRRHASPASCLKCRWQTWLGWGLGPGCTAHSAGGAARWVPCSAVDRQSSTFRPRAGTWHVMQHRTLLVLAFLETSESLGCCVVVVLLQVSLGSVWNKVVKNGLERCPLAVAGAALPCCV